MNKPNSAWVLVVLSLYAFSMNAQDKNDFTWILGYNSNFPELFFGGNYIDFQPGNPAINYFDIPFDMDNPVIMSDSAGGLQYYSSGCNVINREHRIMENGDDLSPGFYHDIYCDQADWGYLSYRGILSLPMPGHAGEYILFHSRRYENNDSIDVLYTLIDMNADSGLGKVPEKNVLLEYGRLSLTFQAVRHGNGRDWWIVIPEEGKDIYHFYLLDPEGIHGPYVQQVSDSWIPGQYYNLMCAFSPDGSRFVRLGGDKPTAFRLYDFDRCTGMLSDPVTVSVPDTIMNAASACFSPNSRYLYLTNEVYRLYQYDTQASDISASAQWIGEYDGFLTVYNLAAGPHSMTLAPDNRIYLSSGNGVNVLHTIHNPDLPGLACDFRQHDVLLPAHILFFLPNNPFFRLYNKKDSPCDTLNIQPPLVAFWRSEPDSLAGPLAMNFTDLSYYQPVTWQWDFGDGTGSTERSPAHVFPAPGIYTVCLTACNESGVCDTLCREIEIVTTGASVPVSPGALPLRVYPNPATGWLWVSHNDMDEESTFTLMNSTGQIVVNRRLPTGSSVDGVDLSGLPSGIYFWKVQASGVQKGAGRVLVQRR
ncbi:MAG: PKD domain-containing protein [Saprospiraceae bacterium]|nr:PKD domain-containing protein [Saprospiraceae bacterium]